MPRRISRELKTLSVWALSLAISGCIGTGGIAPQDQALSANTLATDFVGDEMFEAHPDCPLCYAEYRVRAAPATRLIEDGDVVDLGNRVLQVLHTPGHSPGGISLWEASTQTLFSGDILYDGPLIEDAYHSNLEDYAQSLARLRELPVRTVHGGHFASFSGQRMRELINAWFDAHHLD